MRASIRICSSLIALSSLALPLSGVATAFTATEIIDATGDGAGATLDTPFGVAADASGNVFVTGQNTNNAFRIAPGGTITQIIDSTGDGVNPLSRPLGVAVDSSGNAYVSGAISDNVFRIAPGGTITQIIDAAGDGAGNTLDTPFGVAADLTGNIYVTGQSTSNAFRITPGGTITEIIDATGDGAGNALDLPFGVAADSAGNVYVSGANSNNVFRITPTGTITQIIDATGDGVNALDAPHGVAVDANDNVYVNCFESENVFQITPGGTITQIIDSTGDGLNSLNLPLGIAVDPGGSVYVTGQNSNNAFQITPGGTITQIIDATGDGVNLLDLPLGVGLDSGGDVYVTGSASHNVFRIATETPAVTTIGLFSGGDVGDGLDFSGTFVYAVKMGTPPSGLAVGDATFTADTSTSGFSITSATSGTPPFGGGAVPDYGSSTNDDDLETITSQHRFSADGAVGDDLLIDLTVSAGQEYKLQLLMTEVWSPAGSGTTDRVFDVFVEGTLIADDFNPTTVAGTWTTAPQSGAVITHTFTAGDGTLNIVLEDLEIQNPMLSALTLEGPPVPPSFAALLELFGLAEGGAVVFTIDGVTLTYTASDGQPAFAVLAGISALINANPTLQSLGITSVVEKNSVLTTGQSTEVTVEDPGLAVPSDLDLGRRIPYQGTLAGTGSPATLVFELYEDATGNSRVWGPEQHTVTPDAQGRFSVVLGTSGVDRCARASDQSLDCSGFTDAVSDLDQVTPDGLFVGVQLSDAGVTTQLSPRQSLHPAFHAASASSVVPGGVAMGDLADAIVRRLVPRGSIVAWPADPQRVPVGWLLCDGTVYSSVQFPELAALLLPDDEDGTPTPGTFQVPDYRGRFLRALDLNAGRDPDVAARTEMFPGGPSGAVVGTVQGHATALPFGGIFGGEGEWFSLSSGGNHRHTFNVSLLVHPGIVPNNAETYQGNLASTGSVTTASVGTSHTHTVSSGESSGGDAETRPENAYVHFIIKY